MAECIIGMLGNVFITLVNCSEWIKKQKISLADFILTCLAISRFSYLLVSLFLSCILEFSPHLYASYKVAKSINMLWTMTNQLSTGFATCLSILYFLKIAHFSHSLFLWLKRRMDRVVLGLFMLCMFLLIPEFLWLDKLNGTLYFYITDKSNLTFFSEENGSLFVDTLVSLTLTYFIPVVLSLTSLLLLFLSLVRHTRNLQLNSMGSRDASTQVHRRAMKMVLCFLILFTVHWFSSQLMGWIYFTSWNHRLFVFILMALHAFPSGHTFVLIMGNAKLHKAALKALCHLQRNLREESKSLSFMDRLSRVFSRE
ncbi:taste receptor type 2 member 42-like [Lepus europaeus]|uniref:taste receptor type 2 member 42-like n=1 Tax=Lepus europaeus TaxID=9983 RepID=UPI002B47110B|nr:taste receptor type 2 member 42-like [Lepus europaeus]